MYIYIDRCKWLNYTGADSDTYVALSPLDTMNKNKNKENTYHTVIK